MLIDQSFQIFQSNSAGVLMYFDQTRSIWLSIMRDSQYFSLQHRNISHPQWMEFEGIYSNINSYTIMRDAVIVSFITKSQNSSNCVFHIRKNNDPTNLYSMTLSSESINIDNNININVDEGDFIQVYLDVTSGNVDYPNAGLEISYR